MGQRIKTLEEITVHEKEIEKFINLLKKQGFMPIDPGKQYEHTTSEILEYINLIKECVPNSEEVFTQGNCIGMALLLKSKFPQGEVLHNIDHAVFEYNGLYYDITGEVEKPEGAISINEYSILEIRKLLRNNYGRK